MKPRNRFQLDCLIDGVVQLSIIDDAFEHQVRVDPHKMLGIVAQLAKVGNLHDRTLKLPVNKTESIHYQPRHDRLLRRLVI